jgi:Protein of unknown function (DUF3309)
VSPIWLVVIVLLALALGGSFPGNGYAYSQRWGYAPFSGVGLLLVLLVVWLLWRGRF